MNSSQAGDFMGILDSIKTTINKKSTTQDLDYDFTFSPLNNFLGGGFLNKNSTTNQNTTSYTTTNQTTNYYQNTYDQSVNIIADSPLASLKKGNLGTLSSDPSQDVTPITKTESLTDQTSKTDMTGLIALVALAGIAVYAYKEVML